LGLERRKGQSDTLFCSGVEKNVGVRTWCVVRHTPRPQFLLDWSLHPGTLRYTTSMRVPYAYILLLLWAGSVVPVHAAQIIIDADPVPHGRLDTFYVPVRIETKDECINAVDVSIAYDPYEISVQDIALGDSILTLWTQEPEIVRENGVEVGRVVFSGGIPGGYCGRVAGDLGRADVLAQLVVQGTPKALEVGTFSTTRLVVEPSTTAYVHDGTGNKAETIYQGASITLVQSTSTPRDMWLEDVQADTIAPEYFEITLVEGPSQGSPYHYIIFSTTDKQSGVDHYQVLETDPDRFGMLTWFSREAYWTETQSPYVLRDQRLSSKIMVKAVDKNGNERVVEYTPPMSPIKVFTRPSVLLSILVLLLFVAISALCIVLVLRAVRARSTPPETVDHDVESTSP